MSLMEGPIALLLDIQKALDSGVTVDPRELDHGYKMIYDEPKVGLRRYSFVKIVEGEAQALSIFGLEIPINEITCYNVSYAVKENHRGRGLAVEAVNRGFEKLKIEMTKANLKSFYVEAVIDRNNLQSLKVASKLFSSPALPIEDGESGIPAFHFKKLVTIT